MIAEAGQGTVLVVDDDPVVRRVVSRGIGGLGRLDVLEAEDGEAARDLLTERTVDLVVTDLVMPRLDGLELIRWGTEHTPATVWIILSGVETFDAAVEAIRLGAFEFLSKPVHVKQLEVAVRNALAQRNLERERTRLFAELEESHRTLVEKVQELEAKSEVIRRDLERAEVIQRALLPHEPPRLDGFSLQTFYRPGRYVGGDLYNVVRLNERYVVLYVADATGHGVSSAMLSVLFDRKLALAEAETTQPLSPARVLASVNRAICEERIAPGLFLTAAYCLLDTSDGEGVIALAGHPPALLRRREGELQAFPRTGPALGLAPAASYTEEWFSLEAGDRLLLYTDGLLQTARGGTLGRSWLEDALGRGEAGSRDVVELLGGTVPGADAEDEDRDDVTVLLLDAHPGASHFDNGDSVRGAAQPVSIGARDPVIFYGESEHGCFFAVRGRGTWVHCDAFHEAALAMLDERRTTILDLTECDYLDSTFLGTIYELVRRGEDDGVSFTLQRVSEVLRTMFEELSMGVVLDAIREDAAPLPEQMQPLVTISEPRGSHWRILRAHEALAALSARNRDKFLAVVEAVREQLE